MAGVPINGIKDYAGHASIIETQKYLKFMPQSIDLAGSASTRLAEMSKAQPEAKTPTTEKPFDLSGNVDSPETELFKLRRHGHFIKSSKSCICRRAFDAYLPNHKNTGLGIANEPATWARWSFTVIFPIQSQ
jgi:hypothetical protein